MSMKYSTCLLTPDFVKSDFNLNPGQSFPFSGQKIHLAGGFPAVFPDTPFPLSPTLQLNSDLSSMPDSMLEQVARAELDRHNRIAVRNYAVEPSLFACVIGTDAGLLEEFLDTYGGVLEIEPLLLEDDHTDHAQVTAVEILPESPGYTIIATVRSPVDKQACTYCGACGPACPENCISPALRFDYRICTFCRECEKVCETRAIDIYGVEKRTIHASAIIVLGESKLDLPDDRSGIYTEETLDTYFKTLCSIEVEESIQCDNKICQYSGKLGMGCNLCLEACRFGAVSRDSGGVHIDSLSCTECGKCASVCPTGAINYHRFSDASFTDYLGAISLADTEAVVIGTAGSLHQFWWQNRDGQPSPLFFLEYPNLSALSLYHFLFLLSRGARRILLLKESGKEMDFSCTAQVEAANKFIGSLFGLSDIIKISSVDDLLSDSAPSAVSALTQDHYHPFDNRRSRLASLLAVYYRRVGKEVTLDSSYGAFGTVLCNPDRCTHCFACLNECKIGALRAGSDEQSLLYLTSLCVGCGVCAKVCPEDALRVGQETVLGPAYLEAVELARAEPMKCRQCGKEFGSKKSFEKVMKILASKNMADKGHYEYCDTCRVVKLFESNESA